MVAATAAYVKHQHSVSWWDQPHPSWDVSSWTGSDHPFLLGSKGQSLPVHVGTFRDGCGWSTITTQNAGLDRTWEALVFKDRTLSTTFNSGGIWERTEIFTQNPEDLQLNFSGDRTFGLSAFPISWTLAVCFFVFQTFTWWDLDLKKCRYFSVVKGCFFLNTLKDDFVVIVSRGEIFWAVHRFKIFFFFFLHSVCKAMILKRSARA